MVDDALTKVVLPRRRLFGLVLCSIAMWGLAFSASRALANEAPTIGDVSVSNVTEHDATLEAQINANSRYTGYEFQIDTDGSYNFTRPACPFELPGYAQCESVTIGEPLPEGLVEPQPEYIPARSIGDQPVSLDLASIGATLQQDTTYHYRVVASSGSSTQEVVGPDQTFQTPPSQSLPAGPLAGEEKPPTNNAGEQSGTSSPGVSSSVSSDTSTGSASSATFGAGLFASRVQKVGPNGPNAPTVSRKLAKALERCEKEPKRSRAACKRRVMKKYAATAKYVGKKANNRSRARHR